METIKKNEPLLFRLENNFILITLLSEWLDLNCVGQLDIALTSKTHRSKWFEALREMRSPLIDSFEHDHGSLRWMNSRGVHISKLVFYKSVQGSFPTDFFAELDNVLPQLTSINLDAGWDCNDINDDVAALVGQRCPKLQKLILDYCRGVSQTGYKALLKPYREEHGQAAEDDYYDDDKEHLISVTVNSPAAARPLIECISSYCTRLEHLSLRVVDSTASADMFQQAIRQQHGLKVLVLDCTWRAEALSDGFMLEPFLDNIIQHCPCLEDLLVGGFGLVGTEHQDSPSLGLLRCKKLHLRYCELSLADLAHLASNRFLECLRVERPSGRYDDYVLALSRGCPALKELSIDHYGYCNNKYSPATLEAFSRALFISTLESLALGGAGGVDDQCLTHLSRCTMLHTFDMWSQPRSYTVEGLKALFAGCRLLRSLRLRKLADEDLQAIGDGCPLLERLSVEDCDISSIGLCAMFSKCTLLREVYLGSALDDEKMKCIALHVPNLETLHVSVTDDQVRVTTAGWTLVATHCPLLRHVFYDDDYGDNCETGIEILVRHCPLLESFGVYGRREINAARRRAQEEVRQLAVDLHSIRTIIYNSELTEEIKLRLALNLVHGRLDATLQLNFVLGEYMRKTETAKK